MTSRSTIWRQTKAKMAACLETDSSDSENGQRSNATCTSDDSWSVPEAHCSSPSFESSHSVCFDEEVNQESLASDLAKWAVTHQCTRSSVNELLSLLRAHGNDLPKDARTLLSTLRRVDVKRICAGEYVYLGLLNGITNILHHYDSEFSCYEIKLIVNVDGIPLFKSSSTQLWPILCSFASLPPFAVALFCGDKKPSSVNDFLHDFLEELKFLVEHGFSFHDRFYSVSLLFWCCDAPARSFIKCIKPHNSYHACERCGISGEWQGRVALHGDSHKLRTDDEFAQMMYEDHQVAKSPLIDYGLPCVSGFVLDYMHLVCLGVVRRILLFWSEGPKGARLSSTQLGQISERLTSLSLTSDFVRQPRSLSDVKRWKATEFRSFLLYTAPVVLKNVVKSEVYVHFVTLTVAVRLLDDLSSDAEHIGYAQELLQWFVTQALHLYGPTFTTYNVHSLTHLCDDVTHFKTSLFAMSAFPFENFLQTLKRSVRGKQSPLSQIVKRLAERDESDVAPHVKKIAMRIAVGDKDGWYLLKNRKVARVAEVHTGHIVVEIIPARILCDFFSEPCNSSDLSIFSLLSVASSKRKQIVKADILRKMVCLRHGRKSILIPLCQDVSF